MMMCRVLGMKWFAVSVRESVGHRPAREIRCITCIWAAEVYSHPQAHEMGHLAHMMRVVI